jgi:hypothetical protein
VVRGFQLFLQSVTRSGLAQTTAREVNKVGEGIPFSVWRSASRQCRRNQQREHDNDWFNRVGNGDAGFLQGARDARDGRLQINVGRNNNDHDCGNYD